MKYLAWLPILLLVPLATAEEKSPIELKVVLKSAEYTSPIPLADAKTEIEKVEATLKAIQSRPRAVVLPPAPLMEIELHFVNKSDKPAAITVGGERNRYHFNVAGPGVKTLEPIILARTDVFLVSSSLIIQPGKAHIIAVKQLEDGPRGPGLRTYFTQAGDFKISATYHTTAAEEGEGTLLESAQVPFKVVDKK